MCVGGIVMSLAAFQDSFIFLHGFMVHSFLLSRVGHDWNDLAAAAAEFYCVVYHSLSPHVSFEGHLGFFYFLVIMNKAAIIIHVRVFV